MSTREEEDCREIIEEFKELSEQYPSVRNLSNILLLAGGKAVTFDGWGSATDIETMVIVGKFVDAKDVDTTMASTVGCEEGFCHANAGELMSIYKDFQPVYAFALNIYYGTCPHWMEHFILQHVPTGKYHESTDVYAIEKYFVMNISKRQFMNMIDCPYEW